MNSSRCEGSPPAFSYPKWMSDKCVSMVSDAFNTATTTVKLCAGLGQIRSGTWAAPIAQIRQNYRTALEKNEDGKAVVKAAKMKLPGFLLSGRFKDRSKLGLVAHSGLLCADLDELGEALEPVKEQLKKSPHIFAFFLSPTGTGLKVLFRMPACHECHEQSFAFIQQHVLEFTGAAIDALCKDVSRICFVSHDPDIWIREDEARSIPVKCTHTVGDELSELSVCSVYTIEQAVNISLPRTVHRNHHCLCKFVGALKAYEFNTGTVLNHQELINAFTLWYNKAKPFLDAEQPWHAYNEEFEQAWQNNRHPLRKSMLDRAWDHAQKTASVPREAEQAGLTDPDICLLVTFCRELQLLTLDESFFLSSRDVQRRFHHRCHTTACLWLKKLCRIGILTLTRPGVPRKSAAEYLYNFKLQ
jgi:hypothetical protein